MLTAQLVSLVTHNLGRPRGTFEIARDTMIPGLDQMETHRQTPGYLDVVHVKKTGHRLIGPDKSLKSRRATGTGLEGGQEQLRRGPRDRTKKGSPLTVAQEPTADGTSSTSN